MPSVSVIIPTYNSAQYLPEAIESVLAQTYKDFEIIVIDDGSTDNTKDVVKPYLSRIIFMQKANGGPAQARNLGIRNSSGEYVAFLDADDIWYPEKLELQMKLFQENSQYGLIHSDALITATDNSQADRLWFSAKSRLKGGWVFSDLLVQCFIIPTAVIVKRDCLEQVGLFDENLKCWEGYDLCLRVAFKNQIGFVNAPLFRRRLHESNLFYSSTHREIVSMIKVIKKWEDVALNLPEFDRKTINQQLRTNYFRLGEYYLAQGYPAESRRSLKGSLARGFSLRGIGYLGLSMLPPSVLQHIRKCKHRLGFVTTRIDRI